jgi:hypothetical protein
LHLLPERGPPFQPLTAVEQPDHGRRDPRLGVRLPQRGRDHAEAQQQREDDRRERGRGVL